MLHRFESPFLKGAPGTLARDSRERLSAAFRFMGFEYIQWGSCIQLTKPPVYILTGAQRISLFTVLAVGERLQCLSY